MKSAFRRPWKTYCRSFLIAVAVLYLPHLWNIHTGWGDFAEGKVGLFLLLPGGLPLILLSFAGLPPDPGPFLSILGLALSTAGMIAALTIIGTRSAGWQGFAFIVGAVIGITTVIVYSGLDQMGSC